MKQRVEDKNGLDLLVIVKLFIYLLLFLRIFPWERLALLVHDDSGECENLIQSLGVGCKIGGRRGEIQCTECCNFYF